MGSRLFFHGKGKRPTASWYAWPFNEVVAVVVSSEREVRSSVEKFGATAIYAGEFSEILRHLDGPVIGELEDETDVSWSERNRLSKTERRRQQKLQKLRLS